MRVKTLSFLVLPEVLLVLPSYGKIYVKSSCAVSGRVARRIKSI
jgi:hypothetical protein